MNGDYRCNPFDFQNFDVFEVHMCVNGIHVMGSPLKLDFKNKGANSAAYGNLFDICSENNWPFKKVISITGPPCTHLASICANWEPIIYRHCAYRKHAFDHSI